MRVPPVPRFWGPAREDSPQTCQEGQTTKPCPNLQQAPALQSACPNKQKTLPRKANPSPTGKFFFRICRLIHRNAHTGFMPLQPTALPQHQTAQSVRHAPGLYPKMRTPPPPALWLHFNENKGVTGRKSRFSDRNKGLSSCCGSRPEIPASPCCDAYCLGGPSFS